MGVWTLFCQVLQLRRSQRRNTAALKSAERTNNTALSSACCFWEPWRKSYDTREMLTWHISGRLTHPIPKRPVRRYQNVWHCCHILMSATPAETYEEGCWMVHVQWQLEFQFQPPSVLSHSLTLLEGNYIEPKVCQGKSKIYNNLSPTQEHKSQKKNMLSSFPFPNSSQNCLFSHLQCHQSHRYFSWMQVCYIPET